MTIIISKEGTYHQNRDSEGGTRWDRIGKGIRELAEDDAQKMERSKQPIRVFETSRRVKSFHFKG